MPEVVVADAKQDPTGVVRAEDSPRLLQEGDAVHGGRFVEQAILKSDLGLNPVSDGKVLRLSLPAPTMERRKELSKLVHKLAEDFRVQVRNVRRDAVEEIKKQEKDKKISQDDLRRNEQEIQKLTDHHIKSIDSLLASKEKEILEV